VVVRGSGSGAGGHLFPVAAAIFFFFFLFFYYTKQSNQQQKNSFSGVSYCRESALQIRAVPPVFTPFIFRGAEWNENRTPKMGPGCPH
jgi:hypothetical protein